MFKVMIMPFVRMFFKFCNFFCMFSNFWRDFRTSDFRTWRYFIVVLKSHIMGKAVPLTSVWVPSTWFYVKLFYITNGFHGF